MKRCIGVCLGLLVLGSLPALSKPIKVACLGDSLTEGDGDDRGLGGYPGRLRGRLPKGSQVKNLGHSGWTLEMLLQGYEGKPSQVQQAVQWKPDVCLLWIGSNDLWYLYEYNNPSPADEQQNLQRFGQQLKTCVQKLRNTGSQVVLALLDDQSQRPVAIRGEAFSGISRQEMQRMASQIQAYNRVIASLGRQQGLKVVDFSQGDLFRNPATLADDGNHPNSQGYDRITEIWLKSISTAATR